MFVLTCWYMCMYYSYIGWCQSKHNSVDKILIVISKVGGLIFDLQFHNCWTKIMNVWILDGKNNSKYQNINFLNN